MARSLIAPTRRRWAIWLIYACLGLLICAGVAIYYVNTYNALREDRYLVLATIGAMKVDQVAQWKRERINDATRSARSPYFMEGVSRFLRDVDQNDLRKVLRERLDLERSTYSYADVLLIEGSGEILLSASDNPQHTPPETREAMATAIATKAPTFSRFYQEADSIVYTDIVAPLNLTGVQPTLYLVLRANATHELFPIVEQWPTTSATAEAFMVQITDGNVIFLNDLRHAEDSAFQMSFSLEETTMPAVQAALGRQGLFEGFDYRGVEVLSDLRAVHGTPWFIVTKMDRSEIVDEARVRAFLLGTIGSLALGLLALASGVRYRRQQARLYQQRYEQAQAERAAQDQIREITERLQGILDYSPLIITEMDLQGRYRLISKAGRDIIGKTEEEILGQSAEALFAPEMAAQFRERLQLILDTRESIMVEDSFPVQGRDRVFSTVLFPLTDSQGELRSIGGIAQDITQKAQAEQEQRRLEEQLRQAQKMEAVGRLAGGVAHDFNNMLGVILGHAELALEDAPPGETLQEDLRAIVTAARRSASLTSQLLAFARKQTIAPQALDLNATIEGMIKMLARLIGEHIELVWRPHAELAPVCMDPAQLDQILMNLVINARDAIEDRGRIIIETDQTIFDDQSAKIYLNHKPGAYVTLTVTDTGRGIPKEDIPRLFEPFFTTKPQGEGTGLGLATVYGIASQNGGFLSVYSEVGMGASIKVHLPVHLQETTTTLPDSATEPQDFASEAGETILLVEDEPVLLRMTTRLLQQQGYTVLPVYDPQTVMQIAAAHQGEIHLLITDVIMPGMSGRECWEILHERYPHLKCLFMSGYTADVIAHHGVLEDGIAFIQKPFASKTLYCKVRETLGNAVPP